MTASPLSRPVNWRLLVFWSPASCQQRKTGPGTSHHRSSRSSCSFVPGSHAPVSPSLASFRAAAPFQTRPSTLDLAERCECNATHVLARGAPRARDPEIRRQKAERRHQARRADVAGASAGPPELRRTRSAREPRNHPWNQQSRRRRPRINENENENDMCRCSRSRSRASIWNGCSARHYEMTSRPL